MSRRLPPCRSSGVGARGLLHGPPVFSFRSRLEQGGPSLPGEQEVRSSSQSLAQGYSAPDSSPLTPGGWSCEPGLPGPWPSFPSRQLEAKCWPRGEAFSGAFIPVLGGVGDKASKAFANVPSKARPVLPAVWVTALMDGVGGWCGEPGGGHWPPDKWVTY